MVRGWGPEVLPDGSLRFKGSGQATLDCSDDPTTVKVNGKCLKPLRVEAAQIEFQSPAPQNKTDQCGSNGSSGSAGNPAVGNPIYPVAQSKHEFVDDYSTGGPQPLSLHRFYGRLGDGIEEVGEYSRLGIGWRTNFDAAFRSSGTVTSPSEVFITLPEGRDLLFRNISGAYVNTDYKLLGTGVIKYARPGQHETLTIVGSNFELRTIDDTVRVFNTAGQLLEIRDRGGYTQTLTYDTDGRNTSVTDNLGRTLTFTYDDGGRLYEMTTPDGAVFRYGYLAVVVPPPGQDWGIATANTHQSVLQTVEQVGVAQTTTTYHYEATAFPKKLTGITDARGVRYATFAYDAQGRPISTQHASGQDSYTLSYDDVNRKVTVTNPLGKQTIYTWTTSSTGRARLTEIRGEPSANCPLSIGTRSYDTNNFLSAFVDAEGRRTNYVNDARGLPTSMTRGATTPEAVTTTTTWHASLYLPTQVVEPGLTTSSTYDASGRLTQLSRLDTTAHAVPYSTNGQTRTWDYAYTGPAGLLASVDGPLAGTGDTVSYAYDASGYVTSVTNELGHVTQVTAHNGRGQPTSITDPNGTITTLAYDVQGRLTTMTVNPGANQAETALEYDAIGQVTKITRPDGAFLTYTYNDARRLTAVTAADGEKIEYTHDAMGNVTSRTVKAAGGSIVASQTQTFDELGRLLSQIGASSQTTTYAYEKNDNLKSVTDPRSGLYAYAYDALNRLIRETDQESAQVNLTRDGRDNVTTYADPRGLATTYVRNGFGEVIRQTSPDSGITDYVRDARGLVTERTDARGTVTQYTYDAAGRRLTKTFPSASTEDVGYGYDATAGGNNGVGRLTLLTHEGGSITFAYDARGNVTQEIRTIAGTAHTIGYAYDAADRISETTYPSGRIVTFARDGMGRITGVTSKKSSSDPAETVASAITWQPLSTLLATLTHGNGLALAKTYTQDYEVSRCEVTDGALPVIDLSYARSDLINITGITDTITAANSATFGYSAANRLSTAAGPWGSQGWTYDGVGNRTSETATPPGGSASTDTYAYAGTSNRVETVTRGAQTVRLFAYDAAGNILSDARSGSTYAYTTNAAGRLKTVSYEGNLKGTYTYNGLEQLITRAITNSGPLDGTLHTVHDRAGNVIAEVNASGGTVREYIWLPQGGYADTDLPLAVVDGVETASPVLYHVHADHLGRPIRLTDAAKATAWQATWQPWGAPVSIAGSLVLDARFPGQWFQLESGLHYNWHRHYDPSLGRYTQPDPLGLVDGPSVYGYAKNSPNRYVDRDGRNTLPLPWPIITSVCTANPILCGAAILGTGAYVCYKSFSGGGGGGGDGPKDPKEECKNLCAQGKADKLDQFCDHIGRLGYHPLRIRRCRSAAQSLRQGRGDAGETECKNFCESAFGD